MIRPRTFAIAAVVSTLAAVRGGADEREDWTSSLAPRIADATRRFDGRLSLYVRDLRTGDELAWDADTPTYLSSAIKIVVMLEVLREFDAKSLSPGEAVTFGPENVRDGVGPIGLGPLGRRFTIGELLELMMVRSDNAAADMLMNRVGTRALDELARARGARFGRFETLLGERRAIYGLLDPRGRQLTPMQIYDLGRAATTDERAALFSKFIGSAPPFTGLQLEAAFQAFYSQEVNSAPMRDVGRLLAQIARCDGLSAASCARAHSLMQRCNTGRGRIRAGLPPSIAWAHKTGTQERRACDVGFFFARPDHPVVVAACTRDFWDVHDAERMLAAVGRSIWKVLVPVLGRERGGMVPASGRK